METLSNLECFIRAADGGSFSDAARRLGLTPAAVSRNVAMLEKNLGARLFHRSTRSLALTEAGERLRQRIGANLEELQAALAEVSADRAEPAGVLKVSMPPTFGAGWLLPLLPAFLARYPGVRPEWHFEGRQVDLVGEGYDAAIGGGFELRPGVVARRLAPAHVIAVAAPAYLAARTPPTHPRDAASLDWIGVRSLQTGRMRAWMLRNRAGKEAPLDVTPAIVLSDPVGAREAALLGLGVAMLAVPDVLHQLEQGSLVRVLPAWYADAGSISLYYASRALLPAKTRAFVEFVIAQFERERLAERFAASLAGTAPQPRARR